jgi:hypothetical protein
MKRQLPNRESGRPSTQTTASTAGTVTHEEIAARAYEIFQSRGGEAGSDLDDWLRAEQELIEQRSATYAVSAKSA